MGMLNVAGGEYSDFYIYHLVMYISHCCIFDISSWFFYTMREEIFFDCVFYPLSVLGLNYRVKY